MRSILFFAFASSLLLGSSVPFPTLAQTIELGPGGVRVGQTERT
jgi:hypothetical protein